MGKLLVALLGFGVLFGAGYHYLTTRPSQDAALRGELPPQRLQNAKDAAFRIEQDSQRRADDLLQRSQ